MKTQSILSAIQKLRLLLTRKEKFAWLAILTFSLTTGLFETLTATVIVIFAQIINQPELGLTYYKKLGLGVDHVSSLSQGRIIFYAVILLGLVYLIKNVIAAAEVFYQNLTVQRMNYEFKRRMLHRYSQMDYGFYLTCNSSIGIEILNHSVEQMFSIGSLALAGILSESVVAFFLLAALVYMNPFLAVMILAFGLFFGLILTKGLFPFFYRWSQMILITNQHTTQSLMQFFHAFKEIIISGRQAVFSAVYEKHTYQKSRLQAIQMATNAVPRLVIEVVFMGLLVCTIAVLCFGHEGPANMMGILGGYLYAGFRLMPGMNRIIGQLNVFKSQIPGIERVFTEYRTLPLRPEYEDTHPLVFERSIDIQQVSFRYLNTFGVEALKNISLSIKKGECIGIVGETGSGKSTLVDLILGLQRPSSGTILIDDQYPVFSNQWHQKIGYVPQVIYLMDDTIEANIAFGESVIDEQRVQEVVEAAQLKSYLAALPEGTKTMVGERGVRLSGGERQRIAIARALYHEPEVLIFDEATSALDHGTETRLMETIYRVSQSRTVIMVAHRLTTLQQCDRIVVMDKGKIKKIVSYQQLSTESVSVH